MQDVSPTFCILPWIHLNTTPNGQVYQCCITSFDNACGNAKNNTLEEIWTNTYMQNLRHTMLEGREHTSCERCYLTEKNGLTSFRQSMNRNFEKHMPTTSTRTPDFQLLYWDFRFSNLCNFKCRMCGHELSSHWYDDDQAVLKNRGYSVEKTRVIHVDDNSVKPFTEYIDEFIDQVEEIYFAGGEPLIMDEHYLILEELVRRGRTDVVIRYNTNLSKLEYKRWNVLEMWQKFKTVQIFASLDATGTVAEYVRSGTRWETITENVKNILQRLPGALGVNVTVQLSTVHELPKLIDWLLDAGVNPVNILPSNLLTNPECYSIQVLPEQIKNEVCALLDNHAATLPADAMPHIQGHYAGIKNYMMSKTADERLQQQFYKQTRELDSIRNESFAVAVPALASWWNELETRYG